MSIKKDLSGRFYQKINQLARTRKFPLKAMFELTHQCNFRCIHCYVVPDLKKKELTTNQVKQILDQLKEAGCFHVGFTGGEPLLRKDIFEILGYAKVNGFRITLLTNGYLINKNAAKEIASLGTSLNRVDVSVLGAAKETFEKITGKKAAFAKVMRAIKLLKDEGVDVQIKATLMEPNKEEFIKIKKLAEKIGTMFRYSPSLTPRTNGDQAPLDYQVNPEEVYNIKKMLSGRPDVVNERDLEGWDSGKAMEKPLLRCGAGQSEITISAYGEMNLCLEIPFPQYNLLEGNFRDGWEKIKKFVGNLKVPEGYLCDTCILSPFCRWCPAKGWLLENRSVKCSETEKEMALVEAKHSSLWKKIGADFNT